MRRRAPPEDTAARPYPRSELVHVLRGGELEREPRPLLPIPAPRAVLLREQEIDGTRLHPRRKEPPLLANAEPHDGPAPCHTRREVSYGQRGFQALRDEPATGRDRVGSPSIIAHANSFSRCLSPAAEPDHQIRQRAGVPRRLLRVLQMRRSQ